MALRHIRTRFTIAALADGQTIDVTEMPEQILEWHLGPMGKE